MSTYTHYWRIRKWMPERFGQRCRVLATGRMNSALVEFSDGYKVLTVRWFVRKVKTPTAANAAGG